MGGEVSLKLPFILGHVDDDDPEADKMDKTITSNAATQIIEEECYQDECGGPLSPLLKDQTSIDTVHTDPRTPCKTCATSGGGDDGSGCDCGAADNDAGRTKSTMNVDVIVESDQFRGAPLDETLEVTQIENATTNIDINKSDKETQDGDGGAQHICNIITAQIHHHQAPNEEPTDC